MPSPAWNITERLGIEAVNLDPEHVEVFDCSENPEIAFGLGVEIEVKQDIDFRPRSLANCLKVHTQIAQDFVFDIDFGLKRRAESRSPAGRFAALIGENVGLERGEFFLAYLASNRLDAIEAFDRRLVPGRMIDPPRRTVRPVHANAIVDFATEQLIAGYAKQFGLGVEQRVFDCAKRLRDHAAGCRPRRREQFGVDTLVLEDILPGHPPRQSLNRRADAWRAKAFVILAPADRAVFGRGLDEMVIPPSCIAGENFDVGYP